MIEVKQALVLLFQKEKRVLQKKLISPS